MRLSTLEVGQLDNAQREVFDAIVSGPRAKQARQIGLGGPFGVWVRAPALGGPVQALGAAIRFGSGLDDRVREVAICTVGHFHRAHFEIAAHVDIALKAGVDAACLERLCRDEAPGFTGDEAVAHDVARALLHEHRVDDDTYARAVAAFGEEGTIELVLTVGYYCLVSHTLNAFRVPLAPGMRDHYGDAPT